jgi:hypothetical protein
MASFDSLPDSFPALTCKGCSRPIPLPPAAHPDASRGHGSWPRGNVRRTFLCPQCRHLYEYSAEDVGSFPAEADPRKADTPYNVVCILLPCVTQGGCPSLVRIRTVMPFDKDPKMEALTLLASSVSHGIHCDGHHILSGPVSPYGLAFDAHFDKDWQIGAVGRVA